LGGHELGEMASRLAVESLLNSFAQDKQLSIELLQSNMNRAHEVLINRQKSLAKQSGLKTTLVVLWADQTEIIWGHVGDSRLYIFHGGKICFQTKDHSLPQALVNSGEIKPDEIRFHEDRNRLLQVVGSKERYKPTLANTPYLYKDKDAFLLCTDGFWEYVTEPEMEADYAKSCSPEEWLKRMESRILSQAPQGNDNYSAIAVFVRG
jgi:serine/threonine protein phosphatase PrpC